MWNHELPVSIFLSKLVFSLLLITYVKHFTYVKSLCYGLTPRFIATFLLQQGIIDLERQCLTNAQCSVRECVEMVGIPADMVQPNK